MNKKTNEQNDKLVSVIVPVYNTEQYLQECLSSLINQDYKNIEIILVNDGSKDSSEDICKDFSKIDDRIIFIDSPNMGAASARNKGLDMASGAYIVFVDSDDWIKAGYIQKLYNEIEKKGLDLVVGGRTIYKNGHNQKTLLPGELLPGEHKFELIRDKFIVNLLGDFRLGGNFAKIYKRSIIEDGSIRFNVNITINEDILFNIEYALKSKSVGILNSSDYFYRQREGSLTSLYNENTGPETIRVAEEKIRLLTEKGFLNKKRRDTINNAVISRLVYQYKLTCDDCGYTDFRKRFNRSGKLAQLLKAYMMKHKTPMVGMRFKTRFIALILINFKLSNVVITYVAHLKSMIGKKS